MPVVLRYTREELLEVQKPSELPGTMPLVQNVTTMDSLSPVVRVPLNPAEIYRHWNTRGSRGVGRGRGRGRGRGAVDEATRQALRPYVDSGDRGDRREAGSDGWRTYVVPGVIWSVSRLVVALTVRVRLRVGCCLRASLLCSGFRRDAEPRGFARGRGRGRRGFGDSGSAFGGSGRDSAFGRSSRDRDRDTFSAFSNNRDDETFGDMVGPSNTVRVSACRVLPPRPLTGVLRPRACLRTCRRTRGAC